MNCTQADLDDLLAAFDRDAFGVFCRRLEILIVRGHDAKCRQVLNEFLAHHSITQPSMASHVVEVLPTRIAEALERAGYKTIAAAAKASDADLKSIRGFSLGAINVIRRIARAVQAGTFDRGMIPQSTCGNDPDLAPDWDPPTAHELRVFDNSIFNQESNMNNAMHPASVVSSKVDTLIDVLLNSGDEAVAEVDRAISDLEQKLDNLRRVRKMLAGTAKPARVSAATGKPYGRDSESDAADTETLINQIKAAGEGMTVVDLAKATGMHHMRIRGLIRNTTLLRETKAGHIVAK